MANTDSGIYRITCLPTGRCYIGSAVSFRQRKSEHMSMLRRQAHHSRYLQRSYNKYGSDAIQVDLIISCKPKDLLFYEQRAIDVIKPKFNTNPTAASRLGSTRTPAQVAAWSAKWGKQQSEMIGAANKDPTRRALVAAGVKQAYADGRMVPREKKRSFNGVEYTLSEAAKVFSIDRDTLRKRLGRGMTFAESLTKPVVLGGPGNRVKK